MKFRFLFLFMSSLVVAIVVGWFFDRQSLPLVQNPLKIPDNIDYYLSGVKLKAYNEQGAPRYLLNTPYLEHFVREDISIIQQPDIRFFNNEADWMMTASKGKLIHQDETFELSQQASLQRQQTEQWLHITSEQMLFYPDQETIKMPVSMRMQSADLDLNADSAMLDMKNNHHVFQRVNATYQTTSTHEPS
jgi:LPS export ABC transporter protein LptC